MYSALAPSEGYRDLLQILCKYLYDEREYDVLAACQGHAHAGGKCAVSLQPSAPQVPAGNLTPIPPNPACQPLLVV